MSNYDDWKSRNIAEENEERPSEDEPERPNILAGVEELRKIADITKHTRESTWFNFTAEEILKIVRAVIACPWDIYADALTIDELRYAAKTGKLSNAALVRLKHEYG